MKNRTDEIWEDLSSVIEERSVRDIGQAKSVTESCANVLLSDLRAALLSCNDRASELRRRNEKGETAFIALSFLDSSVLTGAYDLRIDFYDDGFLSDIAEACAYFSYKHLIPIYRESIGVICGEAKKRFIRFMDYEEDALAWKYKDEVLFRMVMSACSFCLPHPDMADFWRRLTVSENCVFTFGGFLHDQQAYCRFPPAEGMTVL
jgi:hypothetical protein